MCKAYKKNNNKTFKLSPLTIGFGIALGFSYSLAQAHTIDPNKPEELDTVVIEEDGRGKDLIGIAETASQGEVSQKQFEYRPLSRNGELIEVVPGAVATQHSGSGKANQYFLRGFNLDHGTDFAVHVDGMPVNLPSHGHGQGYTDLNFLIPELVEKYKRLDEKEIKSYNEANTRRNFIELLFVELGWCVYDKKRFPKKKEPPKGVWIMPSSSMEYPSST